MKVKILILFLLVGAILGCKKDKTQSVAVEFSGEVKRLEASFYMYGTHTIISNNINYALTSKTVDLDKYLNKQVTLEAVKIPGYPIEGGPDYYNVTKVK
ncbi:hypothetical protein MUGA111182_10555 [Mucilaginibacter galii]|uniref:Uncharacterized protein n=1 Tax=Mucilaginibacter galii TaxID=2005073 RepID=A0A917J948_9SPHI|nr:hypothetical protein [Mucilaginibacter galii]GGI50776.1 hypothetical protein GCM10011425_19880 [Mucilaginibacter galii]